MDYNLIFSDNPCYIIAHLAHKTQTAIIFNQTVHQFTIIMFHY